MCSILLECQAVVYHTINRAAFVCLSVCLSVCSPTPPRSFDGSSPNLVGVCRWTSELPLRGQRVNGSMGQRVKRHFFGADDTRLRPRRCKRHGVFCLPSKRRTASKSLIPSTGIITSYQKLYNCNGVDILHVIKLNTVYFSLLLV